MRSLTGLASSLSGLPSSLPSSGSWNSSPWYSSGPSRASALRTISTYSRVRASGRANGTPCQPSDTCGPDTPSPSRKRPPDSTSSVAAVIAVAAGVRAGICMRAEPEPDPLGHGGHVAEHRHRILAPRLGHPDRVETRLVGLHGQRDLLLRGEPGPVGHVQADAHAGILCRT